MVVPKLSRKPVMNTIQPGQPVCVSYVYLKPTMDL
jgi:hypothetical protein